MLRDNETPDRPGDWVPFHSKCVDKLGQMKGAHGQRERNKVHRDVGLGCPVEWHDLWDHASVWTSDDLAQTEMVIRRTQPFNADGVEPHDPGLMMTPVTARDLVTLGYCSGSCLVAADGKDGTSCTCKCKGWWHGHLADTPPL